MEYAPAFGVAFALPAVTNTSDPPAAVPAACSTESFVSPVHVSISVSVASNRVASAGSLVPEPAIASWILLPATPECRAVTTRAGPAAPCGPTVSAPLPCRYARSGSTAPLWSA